MKKTITFLLLAFFSLNAYAQCTPPNIYVVTTPPKKVNDHLDLCNGQIATFTVMDGNTNQVANSPDIRWYLDGELSEWYNGVSSHEYIYESMMYEIELSNACGTSSAYVIVRNTNHSGQYRGTVNIGGPAFACTVSNLFTSRNGITKVNIWDTYQWKKDGAIIPGATKDNYNATVSGNYSCIVGNTCDTIWSNEYPVQINYPTPVISQHDTAVCTGKAVNLPVLNVGGTSIQWKRNGTVIPGVTGQSYLAKEPGIYVFTGKNSCNFNMVSNAVTITHNPTPNSVITPDGPVILCVPGTVTFSATPTGAYTYAWYQQSAVIAGASQSTYSATANGKYSVKITDISTGCSLIPRLLMWQWANLRAIFNHLLPQPMCPGAVVLLTAPADGTVSSYQWKRNGTNISFATNSTCDLNADAATYSVEMVNVCGTYTPSLAITLKPDFTATITPTGPTAFCPGGSVTFNVSTGSGYTYEWLNFSSKIAGATASSYTATTAGQYWAIITNGATSCSRPTAVVKVGTKGVLPTITPAQFSGQNHVCGNVLLTANSAPGFTYQWKKSGINIPGATSQTYSVTVTGTYSVAETGTCGTEVSAEVNPEIYDIFLPASWVEIYATSTPSPDSSGCAAKGLPIVINRFVAPPYAYTFTYQWNRNGVPVADAISSSYTAFVAGDYTIDVSNGCGATRSNIIPVTITPQPTASIVGSTSICPDKTTLLHANRQAGFTYQWKKNGLEVIGVDSTFNADAPATYTVKITDANGCVTESNYINVFEPACGKPTGISAGNITTTSAKVNWTVQPCAYNTQIRYRVNGTSLWTTLGGVNAPTASRNITGLASGTTYDYQLRTKCSSTANIYSAWTASKTFTTLISCLPPTNLTVTVIKKDRATINWTAAGGAYSYKLRTRVQGTAAWTNRTVLAPAVNKVLTGLTNNTIYEYQLQTICDVSGTPASAWTAIKTFTTLLREEGANNLEAYDFNVYPNPVGERLSVISYQLISGGELRVADLLGRIYFSVPISNALTTIDVSNLAAGVYFVTLRMGEGEVTKKFVKN